MIGALVAYLDPGSGSALFQVLLATAITALFFVRQLWARAVGLVRRLFVRPPVE